MKKVRIAVNMNGEKKELYMGKGVINRIQKYGPDESPAEVLFSMADQMQRQEVAQQFAGMKDGGQLVIVDFQNNYNFTVVTDYDGIEVVDVRFTREPRPTRYNRLNPWVVVLPEAVEVLSFFSYGRMAAIV